MKRIGLLLSALFILSFYACQNTTEASEAETEEVTSVSIYFDKIVFAEGGDFLGLELGESKESALAKMPEAAKTEQTASYTYYEWKLDSNVYYIDLYFNESGVLASIDGYVYFYNEGKYFDNASAEVFYINLRDYFIKRFGDQEEVKGDARYTLWNLENYTVEVGLQEGEVYWFILLKNPESSPSETV